MIDKTRIPRILDKLRLLWEKNPNMSLIQLLRNVEPAIDNGAPFDSLRKDYGPLSDEDLEWAIEHYWDECYGGHN